MTYTVLPRPGIMDISPYVAGESKISGSQQIIKLSSNEGAFGPSPKAIDALQNATKTMHRYPDANAGTLRQAIADQYGLDRERIVCGAGSDEIISLLCFAYAGPGDEVLYSQYGFLMYPISAKAAGATPVKALETNMKTDVDALLKAVTEKTRIVFVANPNNPTGTYISSAEMARLRQGLPDKVLLVIDAAYAEFVDQGDYTPGVEIVNSGQNTVMTRTFSKMFGLGGLRVGWGYCPREIADVLNRVRGPFNVSCAAQTAAIASLGDHEFQEKSVKHTLKWIAKTQAALQNLGLTTTQSVANFVMVQFKDSDTAEACDLYLRTQGIIVRRINSYNLPQALRISIGTDSEMEAMLSAIKDFMKSQS